MGSELHKRNNKVGSRGTAGPEKVKYYLLRTESPVKGEDMKESDYIIQKSRKTSESGVSGNRKHRSSGVFRKWKTSEIPEFPEIE